jgi:hypothetical protein
MTFQHKTQTCNNILTIHPRDGTNRIMRRLTILYSSVNIVRDIEWRRMVGHVEYKIQTRNSYKRTTWIQVYMGG